MNIYKNKIFLLISLGLSLPIVFTCHNTADNRLHEDKEQKSIVINRVFKEMNVITDINERLIEDLTMKYSTSEEFFKFMNFAQEAAHNDKSEYIDLRHLDQAFKYTIYGHTFITNHDDTEAYKVAHHEAAHAVVCLVEDSGDDMCWVSIQQHNDTLGHMYISRQRKHLTENQRRSRMNVFLAGGIAEQVFGIPEKCEFNNYNEMLYDFLLQRKTAHSDFARARKEADILASAQLQKKSAENDVAETNLDINIQEEDIEFRDIRNDIIEVQYYATIKLVTDLRSAISAVAQELLEKKVISYKRVQTIIQETGCLK